MMPPEQSIILLVEDRLDDYLLVQRALAKAGLSNPFFHVHDGEEAMDYLEGAREFKDRAKFPLPDLVLLDLKLPRMDGFEVLREVRRNPVFRTLPIIVLTSSQDLADVNRAYELGANSFLVKPLEFDHYPAMMRTLSSFWLRQNLVAPLQRSSGPADARAK